MSDGTEKKNKLEALARDVMLLSRNTLLVNLRFLDMALSRLELAAGEGGLWTDGRRIYYSAGQVLKTYKAEKEAPVRDYLHMVMHCVFRHMFANPGSGRRYWNLACDIAVEAAIGQLRLKAAGAAREAEQAAFLEQLGQDLDLITAEKVFVYLKNGHFEPEYLEKLEHLFRADDHSGWFGPEEKGEPLQEEADDERAGDIPGEGEEIEEGEEAEEDGSVAGGQVQQNAADEHDAPKGQDSGTLAEEWKEIAEKLQTDLETFSKEQGDRAGALMQNLCEVNRDRVDYGAFLRKFASLGEVMKINDDEFDHIFYTYGLSLYENMPLVEPLEFKEVKRVREFVIAIDTSGSTSGQLVQRFVEKTYNILKSTENFFSGINLHIIQCDADIQDHVKITCQEDFDAYLKSMRILGQGGTDFRPVFRLVDRLISEKEFHNLRGLIYFTDGCGTFPERMPAYKTAFVFLGESYFNPQVPPWAIKLLMDKDEISEMTE